MTAAWKVKSDMGVDVVFDTLDLMRRLSVTGTRDTRKLMWTLECMTVISCAVGSGKADVNVQSSSSSPPPSPTPAGGFGDVVWLSCEVGADAADAGMTCCRIAC